MRRTALIFLGSLLIGVSAWWLLRFPSEASGPAPAVNRSAAQTFSKKLAAMALQESHSIRQTEFTEPEIDAFLHFELSQHYPQGVRQIRVRFQEDALVARALVNFDQMQADPNLAINPLLAALLRGEHRLEVASKFIAGNGVGRYDILGVRMDDKEVPRLLIDLLLTHYVLPKYPEAKPNTDINLPYNIQSIQLSPGKASVRHGT